MISGDRGASWREAGAGRRMRSPIDQQRLQQASPGAAFAGPAAHDPAGLQLVFSRPQHGATCLARRRVPYPYALTSPLRLDREPAHMATVILQSISGGIYANEQLIQSFEVLSGAAARVMTPSATVVHAMPNGSKASQSINLAAGAGALLEWLPQPLVLFPDARLTQRLVIKAAPDAIVLVTEGFLAHDHIGKGATFDWLNTQIELRRCDGRLVAIDRSHCSGDMLRARLPGIAGRFVAFGTILACAELPQEKVAQLSEAMIASAQSISGLYVGATVVRGNVGILLRIAAEDGGSLVLALPAIARRAHLELIGIAHAHSYGANAGESAASSKLSRILDFEGSPNWQR
jgi:urease accessory protein